MILLVKDDRGNLMGKDILMLDLDMAVKPHLSGNGKARYQVALNRHLTLAEDFEDQERAEERLITIADARNQLEAELAKLE